MNHAVIKHRISFYTNSAYVFPVESHFVILKFNNNVLL